MGIVETLLGLLGGDDEADYVCLKCAAEFARQHCECPECGNLYVASTDEE